MRVSFQHELSEFSMSTVENGEKTLFHILSALIDFSFISSSRYDVYLTSSFIFMLNIYLLLHFH